MGTECSRVQCMKPLWAGWAAASCRTTCAGPVAALARTQCRSPPSTWPGLAFQPTRAVEIDGGGGRCCTHRACPRRPSRPAHSRMPTSASVYSTFEEAKAKVWWRLPRSIRKPLGAWLARFAMVLSPAWIGTTLAVWGAWFGMSLGTLGVGVFPVCS